MWPRRARRTPPFNTAGRIAALVGVTAGVGCLVRALWSLRSALGASISAIAPHTSGAVSYRERRFHNVEPQGPLAPAAAPSLLWSLLREYRTGRPRGRIPVVATNVPEAAGELAVTWYGHASAMVEVDGFRVLTDPVWSKRVSPSRLVGPVRMHPVPVALAQVPAVDAVVISHDHYDHLDADTIRALTAWQRAPFVVPLGVGAHLRHWGVPEDRIVELDWGQSVRLPKLAGGAAELELRCVRARHFSGRGLARNTTLWASWALCGPRHRVYFGGDTGYTDAFAEAGKQFGPFDLTLLPIGAYDVRWADIHVNPEEAVAAHGDLGGGDPEYGMMVPIHWATFNLAFHLWSEPVRRLLAAAAAAGTTVRVPLPGQRLEPHDPPPENFWWEDIDER